MTRSICSLLILNILLVIFLSMIGCENTVDSPVINWELIWQDEFDGSSGQMPVSEKWGYDIGNGNNGWGNGQLEYDTNRPENVSLDGNGNLAVIAREESYEEQDYTSARILTKDLFEPTYGRIEARIKLPIGQGIWPAFWMLGTNIKSVGWPQCGEIDIMEYRGQEPKFISGSLHGPGYSGGNPLTRRFYLQDGQFDDDFHIFAIEWTIGEIRWYVDDIHYFTAKPEDANGEWVFNQPFYIILNVAVGGNFVGPPNSSTVFPQTMLIDYVRVYGTN